MLSYLSRVIIMLKGLRSGGHVFKVLSLKVGGDRMFLQGTGRDGKSEGCFLRIRRKLNLTCVSTYW